MQQDSQTKIELCEHQFRSSGAGAIVLRLRSSRGRGRARYPSLRPPNENSAYDRTSSPAPALAAILGVTKRLIHGWSAAAKAYRIVP